MRFKLTRKEHSKIDIHRKIVMASIQCAKYKVYTYIHTSQTLLDIITNLIIYTATVYIIATCRRIAFLVLLCFLQHYCFFFCSTIHRSVCNGYTDTYIHNQFNNVPTSQSQQFIYNPTGVINTLVIKHIMIYS